MKPVQDLFAELVERRLWPVALVLVLALAAVPLVLSKSPADTSSADGATPAGLPASAVAAAAAAPEPAVVTLASDAERRIAPDGKRKDPFRQRFTKKKASAAQDDIAAGGSPPATGGTGGTGGTGSPGGSPPPSKAYLVARIDVRFGKATGPLYKHGDVPRLTPLPGPAKPLVIFLGMRKDLETAVFMISSDVHAQGDGTCTPSRKECTAIELKEGDVAFLDVTAANGRVTQYELDLVDVSVESTTSKAEAQAAYARVSHVGSRLLERRVRASARNTSAGGRRYRVPYRYAAARGVLHIAPFLSRSVAGRPHASGSAQTTRTVPVR